jgi:hypothetical protein
MFDKTTIGWTNNGRFKMAFDSTSFRKSMARLLAEPGAQTTLNLLVAERDAIMAALIAGRKNVEIYRALKECGMTVSYISFCEAMRQFCDRANLTRNKRREFLLIKQRTMLREALEKVVPPEKVLVRPHTVPVSTIFNQPPMRGATRRTMAKQETVNQPNVGAPAPARAGTQSPLDVYREQMRTV